MSKFGEGIPINDISVIDEQREISSLFAKIANSKPGWHTASIEYRINEEGYINLIGETKIYSTGDKTLRELNDKS